MKVARRVLRGPRRSNAPGLPDFGFYPLVAYLDATGEALAGLLRPGNSGSGTGEDHICVLDASLAQLPIDPAHHEVIVRTDSGGTSHALAQACRERGVRFVGGFRLKAPLAQVVTTVPKRRWKKAVSSDGTEELETGQVAEVTDLVDLSAWPEGTRMIARRELPHPGAQLHFTDVDGYRYQVFVTDCQRPRQNPHRRPTELPTDGQRNSPGTATGIPQERTATSSPSTT